MPFEIQEIPWHTFILVYEHAFENVYASFLYRLLSCICVYNYLYIISYNICNCYNKCCDACSFYYQATFKKWYAYKLFINTHPVHYFRMNYSYTTLRYRVICTRTTYILNYHELIRCLLVATHGHICLGLRVPQCVRLVPPKAFGKSCEEPLSVSVILLRNFLS